MRTLVLILSLMAAGCQAGPSVLVQHTGEPVAVMSAWGLYQACLSTSDLESARGLAGQLHRVTVHKVEPPAWMASLSAHVATQPLRVTVDPQALGAACALRVAKLATEAHLLPEAEARYRAVIEQYRDLEYAHYTGQARQALSDLKDQVPALVALFPLFPR